MSLSFKILIVDQVHPALMEMLASKGIAYEYCPNLGRPEVEAAISGFQGLVIRSKFKVDGAFLQKARHLRLIGRAGAGLDTIDMEAATSHGIQVVHAAEGNADAVGEHTIGLLLMLLNKLAMADQSVRAGHWDREAFRGIELNGKTVGLLGYGNMGTAVAKRLQSFGCTVIAYDKYLEVFPTPFAQKVTLDELKLESQILSLHIPLTEETRQWVNYEFLSSFQKLDFFINTSRGEIVPIEDLLTLLETGFLKGAALDVLPDEPPTTIDKKLSSKYETLFRRPDVILSPHVAGWSLESYEKISCVLGNRLIYHIGQLKN